MEQFNFNEAYASIVKASVEQDKKEIPLLLNSADFKDKKCLEIGAGPLARLAVKLLKSEKAPKHITCLDPWNSDKIKQVIKKENLENKISVVKPSETKKLPFKNDSFDIIYAGWIPSDLLKNQKYLDELARVSKKHIILIMPGLKGDLPLMRTSILGVKEIQKRKDLKKFLTNYFKKLNYKVDTSNQTTLKLDFPDIDTAFKTFYFFDFKNELIEKNQKKLKEHLKPKIHNLRDNLYIFHAWKE
jgi:ubiquinone/menaquinone biosynthesis C-methylase UbiE